MYVSSANSSGDRSARKRQLAKAQKLADKAEALIAAQRYEEAIQCQREVAAIRRDDPMAYHQLGLLYREVYSYSPAVDAFRQAAELDPFHCGPRESLVDTLVDASRYTEAIDEAKALIKVAPANTFARHILSIVYFQLGDIQNALNMTVEISNLDPFDCHNHLRRASLYQHRGEFKNALQSYDRALEHTENATPLHDDILEAIEGLDDEQTHVVLLLASEDRMFSIKLQKDLEFALSERGFSLSRGGFLRLRSVISEQNFADTFVSHPVQPSGSWYYN